MQLTPHLHCLVPESMWTSTGEVPPPPDDEVVVVLRRVLTLARRDFEAAEAAFGTDVLQCPCGRRRTVRRLHLGRKRAEARLA